MSATINNLTNMAEGGPGNIIDAILSSEELRSSLARAVEASGSVRQQSTSRRYDAIEDEVSAVFRGGKTQPNVQAVQQVHQHGGSTQTMAAGTSGAALGSQQRTATYPIFQMRRNYK